jgi:dUTP pyrophosphatase
MNINQSNPIIVRVKPVEGETPLIEYPPLPTYATDGSAAFDIHANDDYVLNYGSPVIINTGFIFEIPPGYGMFIYSRSGHGFKDNIRLSNCVGIIDSDYRGELKIKLTMDFPSWQTTYNISKGDRIAQGIVIPTSRVSFILTDSLTETGRGQGGFGSTGK